VGADQAAISCGVRNRFGHPHSAPCALFWHAVRSTEPTKMARSLVDGRNDHLVAVAAGGGSRKVGLPFVVGHAAGLRYRSWTENG